MRGRETPASNPVVDGPAVGSAADAAFVGALLRWIGRTWVDDGDLDAADDCLQAALATAEAAGDKGSAAHALNLLAITAWRRGLIDEAEQLYLRARALAEGAGGEARLVAMIEQNLGIIANVGGDLHRALRCYSESLAAYRTLGMTSHVAPVLNNLGMLHTDQRRWHEAERAYEEALDVCAITGDVGTRIMVEVNRAELWIAQRDFARARVACDTARGLIGESGDARALGETQKHYGVIAREERRYDEAAEHFQRAWSIAEETHDHLLSAETAREQAELCWRMQRNTETLNWLTRAHGLFSGIRARRELADVGARVERLELLFLSIVKEWGSSIEAKDRYTRGHCDRVAEYACALAAGFGFDEQRLFWFRLGALLHDVGKISVPSEILNKPGRLTAEERAIVEHHPIAGVELLSGTDFPEDIVPMVRSHHERWDGRGYPDGLRGERIPLAARILCVADVYDALTSDRPYRRGYDRAAALRIMSRDVGRVFDPRAFAMFASLGASVDERVRDTAPRRISMAIRPRTLAGGDFTEARIRSA
jgi:putative nucleotidyltransferase with HDIG domain